MCYQCIVSSFIFILSVCIFDGTDLSPFFQYRKLSRKEKVATPKRRALAHRRTPGKFLLSSVHSHS